MWGGVVILSVSPSPSQLQGPFGPLWPLLGMRVRRETPGLRVKRFRPRSNRATFFRFIGTIRATPAMKPPMCAHQATPPPVPPAAMAAEKN